MTVGLGVLVLAVLVLVGVTLGRASRTPADREALVQRIEALLPQTQCGACGYGGCRPYAQALAAPQNHAAIDRCPPGGLRTLRALAELLGVEAGPAPFAADPTPVVARIDEDLCIGCTKCIRACPVDAIIGAPRVLHAVVEPWCTGCALCVPACPVDCIRIESPDGGRRP